MTDLVIEPDRTPGARTVSWSEISTGRMCLHKHALAYKERWTMKPGPGHPLTKGTMFHMVMESWYNSLKERPGEMAPARTAVDLVFAAFAETGRDSDDISLVRWMFEGYVERYGTDDQWIILAVEYRFEVPLRTRAGRLSGFNLKGGIDLVIKDRRTGRIWVIDHKSAANLPTALDLDFDDQLGLYTWGLVQLGKPIFSALYSASRTTRNKGDYPEVVAQWHRDKAAGLKPGAQPKPQPLEGRFMREPTTRTPVELEVLAQEALATARRLYGARNQHERTTDPDRCKWKCQFREACLMGRKTSPTREREYLADVGFVQDHTRH